jgi:transcriptional antiterminator RfaH
VNFGSEGAAAVVPDEVIRELRSSVQDNETIEIAPGLEEGEEVNVVSGPFQGVRAIVSRLLPAKQRVAILLNLLGMEREVEVSMENVLPDIHHPLLDDSASGHPAKKSI